MNEKYIRLKWKLSAGFGFLVLVCTLVTSFALFRGERERFENDQRKKLKSLSGLITLNVDSDKLAKISSEDDPYYTEIKRVLSSLYRKFNLGWLAIYRFENGLFREIVDGADLGESFCFGYPIFGSSEDMQKALKGEFVIADLFEDLYGTWRSAFCPIKNSKGEVIAIIDISQDCEQLNMMRDKIFNHSLWIMLTGVVFGMAFANLFAKLITVGLEQLIDGLRVVGAGDLNYRFPIVSRDEIGLLATNLNKMVSELQEKMRLSRFVSESVRNIVKSNSRDLILTGEERHVAVLFSDIRSFTTISEQNSPRDVVTMLNSYLDVMTEIIQRNGGVIDKFIGDAIMAVFYNVEDHQKASAPVLAGMEMMEELVLYNESRKAKGLFTVNIGVGIAYGPVIAGVIGSKSGRVEYTVIGDTVNLASRLEGTSKHGRHLKIVVSESMHQMISDSFETEAMEITHVKGKENSVKMYEIVAIRDVEKHIAELNSSDDQIRLNAMNFLRLSGRKNLLSTFAGLFEDPSSKVRIGAGKAMRNFVKFGTDAVTVFKNALNNEKDVKTLSAMIMDFGTIASGSDIMGLCCYLDHDDERVRANAVEILGRISDVALLEKHLVPMLTDKSSRARANAAFILFKSGKIDGLRTLMDMCDFKASLPMKMSGAWGFGEIAELERSRKDDPQWTGRAELEDGDYKIEMEVILGKGRMAIEAMLDNPDNALVRRAAITLGKIKSRSSMVPLSRAIARFTSEDHLHQAILGAITDISRG
ncbi:MAG: HAMP domain-containing protein [Candidatus Riflebacteria bacterium]|nr:HAMP domain-containing protein [Candidatus Riflebacteria bacterium]